MKQATLFDTEELLVPGKQMWYIKYRAEEYDKKGNRIKGQWKEWEEETTRENLDIWLECMKEWQIIEIKQLKP